MFQISNLSVKPFNLELGEHRDIEFQNYYIDTFEIYVFRIEVPNAEEYSIYSIIITLMRIRN